MATPPFYVHPTSVIEEKVSIGKGTRIWLYTHIMPGAAIGTDCNIGQNVFIDRDVIIGNRVKIQNNVSIYTGVECEDEVFIGPSAVFTNVINPRSHIERKNDFQKTKIQKGATIGANATIVCGITIGAYAFVGAGAVVTGNVSAYQLVTGNPAKPVGWVSESGDKLQFDRSGRAICNQSGQEYILNDETVRKSG